MQVALHDDAHGAVPRVQGMHQIERAIGIAARFHIDADETAQFGGAADELVHVGQALIVGKIEAELRQLERDVALDAVGVDGIERPQVDVAGFGGFFQGGNAFAQVVESHRDALGVEFAGDGQRLIECFTSHEPGGEPPREGRGFHPSA